MLEWNDAKDISWYYVQKCDGLSRATSARSGRATGMSSRAARVRNATSFSEATSAAMEKQGASPEETLHEETKCERAWNSYWIGRAL